MYFTRKIGDSHINSDTSWQDGGIQSVAQTHYDIIGKLGIGTGAKTNDAIGTKNVT